jgi:hypothetical protein
MELGTDRELALVARIGEVADLGGGSGTKMGRIDVLRPRRRCERREE